MAGFFEGIWAFIVDLISGFLSAIGGMIDALIPAVPSQLVGACGTVAAYVQRQAWLTELIPLQAVAAGGVLVLGCITAAVTIRLLRIGVSIQSGGGGA